MLGDTETVDPNLAIEDLVRLLTANVSFGVPLNYLNGAEVGQTVINMRGSWVTVSLTAAAGTITITHNLNIPTTQVTGGGGTANLPNVRWLLFGLVYGDRTGATAAPAAPTGNVTFLQNVSATVTADAIDLRYMVTGFAPDATHPLQATFFVVPAVV